MLHPTAYFQRRSLYCFSPNCRFSFVEYQSPQTRDAVAEGRDQPGFRNRFSLPRIGRTRVKATTFGPIEIRHWRQATTKPHLNQTRRNELQLPLLLLILDRSFIYMIPLTFTFLTIRSAHITTRERAVQYGVLILAPAPLSEAVNEDVY